MNKETWDRLSADLLDLARLLEAYTALLMSFMLATLVRELHPEVLWLPLPYAIVTLWRWATCLRHNRVIWERVALRVGIMLLLIAATWYILFWWGHFYEGLR